MFVVCKEKMTSEQILEDLICNYGHERAECEVVATFFKDEEEKANAYLDLTNHQDLDSNNRSFRDTGYVVRKVKLNIEGK